MSSGMVPTCLQRRTIPDDMVLMNKAVRTSNTARNSGTSIWKRAESKFAVPDGTLLEDLSYLNPHSSECILQAALLHFTANGRCGTKTINKLRTQEMFLALDLFLVLEF
jgi:hypothetical protein